MSAGLTVLRALTVVTAVLLCVSPWADYRRIVRDQSTGVLSGLPVLMLFVNGYMWLMYAYLVGNWFPLFAVGCFGCSLCLLFMGIYYRWSDNRAKLHRMFAASFVFLAAWTAYVILATSGVTGQNNDQVSKVLGYMCVALNIGVYASPLDTMQVVIRTKSADALPISLCTMNLINGSLWVVFGAVTADYFVLTPNAIGALLGAIQVGLYVKFRPSAGETGAVNIQDDVAATKTNVAIVVSADDEPHPDSAATKSEAYHALASPH